MTFELVHYLTLSNIQKGKCALILFEICIFSDKKYEARNNLHVRKIDFLSPKLFNEIKVPHKMNEI